MSKLIYISFVFGLLAISWQDGFGQQRTMLCIYFEEDTEFINVGMREDSTFTSFSIVKKGFETEEQRKNVRKEYNRQVDPYQPPPSFTINFISSWKPEKVKSIKEINDNDCSRLVTVDELRNEGFDGSLVIFIKKLQDGTFLNWVTVLMAEE
jgi:hypothetical protein